MMGRALMPFLRASLKPLCTHACSMGNKQEELEVCMQLQGYDLIGVPETWWDSSQEWARVLAVDEYRHFGKDRLGEHRG